MNIITSTKSLEAFCQALAAHDAHGYITVDTEFQREETYWPELCLIQIAGSQEHALIDPLAPGMDLAPLRDLMRNPEILKVFHAARQDLEIFYQLWQELPTPLFDTQIAAMACGFGESVGYSHLVEHLVQQTLDKTSQFTNWQRRPLSDKQLTYALHDVTYLRTVYEKLHAKLDRAGRLAWLQDESKNLLDVAAYEPDPTRLWMALKPKSKSPRFLARLREVAVLRDTLARQKNVPRSRILKDATLLEMAARTPDSLQGFEELRGAPAGFGSKADHFLQALHRADQYPLDQCPTWPKKPVASAAQIEAVVDLLRVYLKHVSQAHEVAPKMVASPEDLYAIAAAGDRPCKALDGWRAEVFGNDAQAICRGEKFLLVRKGRITLASASSSDLQ